MNLVMIHLGGPVPKHFWIALDQAWKHHKHPIWLILPDAEIDKLENENMIMTVQLIRQSELINHEAVNRFREVSFMDAVYGDFWNFAFMRLFFLEALISKYNLTDVIHIENDVLIYKSPASMKRTFQLCYSNSIAINPVGPKYAAFAYVYCPNAKAIEFMNAKLIGLLKRGIDSLMAQIGEGMINEMLLLKIVADENPNEVKYLPSLPFGPYSEHAEKFGCLFDPASYGQFIGGTGANNIGWRGNHHWIGREINKQTIKFSYGLTVPILIQSNYLEFPLGNLHVHSKELMKYVY